jgi:hypothetical protein
MLLLHQPPNTPFRPQACKHIVDCGSSSEGNTAFIPGDSPKTPGFLIKRLRQLPSIFLAVCVWLSFCIPKFILIVILIRGLLVNGCRPNGEWRCVLRDDKGSCRAFKKAPELLSAKSPR